MTRSIVVVLAMVVAAGCGGSAGSSAPSHASASAGPIPLVVDTDLSSDDIMALAFLVTQTTFEIRAITVVGTGVVHCGPGVDNILDLLHELNHAPVPVACGPDAVPPGVRPIPEVWRLEADRAYGLALADSPAAGAKSAIDVFARAVGGADQPVALLTLGPLTNVAAALAADDDLAGRIDRIVSMGGAIGVPGNASIDGTETATEWNIASDPVAAAAVFESGIPILLVPLDATNHVPLTQEFVDALRVDVDAGPADLVDELVTRNPYLVGGSDFWDPLAAVSLVDPSVVTAEDARISVDLSGAEFGRTRSTSDGALVAVAVGADRAAFESTFLAGLRDGGPRLTPYEAGR